MKFPRLVPAFALAALGSAILAACGADPAEQLPAVRDMLRDLARATIANDFDRIISHVVGPAGQGDNPIGAKEWETPEGKKNIQEGNKRQIRAMFKDAGIVSEGDIDRFLQAVKVSFGDAKNCQAIFFIAPEGRRAGEKVTLRLTKTEQGWKIYDYFRDIIR
jgi:ketosteroid isomerase-like protein